MCRYLLQVVEGVSIHTPTQGVTPRRNPAHRHTDRFNPHTHAGCDAMSFPETHSPVCFNPHTHAGCDFSSIFCEFHGMFQSTHPRRVWQSLMYCPCFFQGFNPHTHAGCDYIKVFQLRQYNVSIHTPTQGVTCTHICQRWFQLGFNPHTHAGCDFPFSPMNTYKNSFNPHTHAGCDFVFKC